MTQVAAHIRIFDPAPSDDLVAKRTVAIGEIKKKFEEDGRSAEVILRAANDLAHAAEPGSSFSAEQSRMIETAISASASAFIAEGHHTEMVVCGMLGALQCLDGDGTSSGSTTINDVFALGLWSALSFQKPSTDVKFEALRAELREKAHAYCMRTAAKGRERWEIEDPEFKSPETFDPEEVETSMEPFATAITNLRANAAVDREELDLLWWVLSDWSSLLGRRLSTDKVAASAAVASGFEMGFLMRRIPAEAHRHLALRNVPSGKALTLVELLSASDADRSALFSAFKPSGLVSKCPAVFPLAEALRTGEAKGGNAKIKRSIEDWTARALLEASIARLTANIPSVAL